MKAVLLPNIVGFPAVSMERYARELLSGLRGLHENGWEFDELVCGNASLVEKMLPGTQGQKMGSRVGRFIKYPRLASQARGDVFHVLDHSHANLTWSLAGEKTVLTCHDIIPFLAAKGLIPIPAGRFTRYSFPQRIRAMRRCKRIIAISESTKRDLIEHADIPAERIRVVYYGVNPNFTPGDDAAKERRIALRQKYGFPGEARVILHVGTATRYKNTPALFHALRMLRSDTALSENVYLLRVGADFYPDEDALLDELRIRDRVVHAGRVFDDRLLADHYRAADVFAFPSIWEGFGWPPLEAMACGTPAVTSNIASLPEVVGEGGMTVAPQDHAALADALRRILTDDALRAELSRKSVARASQFTWERCARETLAVYNEIVN